MRWRQAGDRLVGRLRPLPVSVAGRTAAEDPARRAGPVGQVAEATGPRLRVGDYAAARAPKLRKAVRVARKVGWVYVILDRTLIPIGRLAVDRRFYSGKHQKHGMNLQAIARSEYRQPSPASNKLRWAPGCGRSGGRRPTSPRASPSAGPGGALAQQRVQLGDVRLFDPASGRALPPAHPGGRSAW